MLCGLFRTKTNKKMANKTDIRSVGDGPALMDFAIEFSTSLTLSKLIENEAYDHLGIFW